jgi:acyl-CoA thioesterase
MTDEEAIEILENDIEVCTIQQKQACDMAIKALEQTRWIPVSERLPEDYIHVLCQFTLNGMGECYLAHGVFHVVGGLVMTCNEVIAWMPLPQPYKEDANDNDK